MEADAAIFMIFLRGVPLGRSHSRPISYADRDVQSGTSIARRVAVFSVIHFLCQFSSSHSVNPIVNAGGPYSLFLFFVGSLSSLLFVFFIIPEMSGCLLEKSRTFSKRRRVPYRMHSKSSSTSQRRCGHGQRCSHFQ